MKAKTVDTPARVRHSRAIQATINVRTGHALRPSTFEELMRFYSNPGVSFAAVGA